MQALAIGITLITAGSDLLSLVYIDYSDRIVLFCLRKEMRLINDI